MNFFIKTFGCQHNRADSERLATYYMHRGFLYTDELLNADLVVINTCMIREKAEEKVYGFIRNLKKDTHVKKLRIIMTGCIVGAAAREPSGKMKKKLSERVPDVELLPIEDVGFEIVPERGYKDHVWVPISNGCNNFCTFCIVPFSRGKEISRPFNDIIVEVEEAVRCGANSVTLLGQNVNSYGADLVLKTRENNADQKFYELPDQRRVEPVLVTSLNRTRIPTLFPFLLERIAQIAGITHLSFISSNPWDFSDELISVIAQYDNIERVLHLPVQAGDTEILNKMNRWYTREEYIDLILKIRKKIPEVLFATDIIVGFPGETEEQFEKTVDLCKKVGFVKAFIACYSPRPGTKAAKDFTDNVPYEEKKRRFRVLDELINHKNININVNWIQR